MADIIAIEEVSKPVLAYTLVLSEEEVKTLVSVLKCVGGDPYYSPRKFVDNILSALISAGVKDYESFDGDSFYFKG